MSIFGITKTSARAGLACLAAATLVAAMPGKAAARHIRHIAHHRLHKQIETVQTASGPNSNLGAMRYYGGPKSPMWREVGVQTASVQPTSTNSGGMRYYGGPKSPMWRQ